MSRAGLVAAWADEPTHFDLGRPGFHPPRRVVSSPPRGSGRSFLFNAAGGPLCGCPQQRHRARGRPPFGAGHAGVGLSRNEFSSPGQTLDLGFLGNVSSLPVQTNQVPAGFDFGSHNGLGPLGGAQLGYNYQFPNSPFIIGIEGEYSFADLKGSNQISLSTGAAFNGVPLAGCPGCTATAFGTGIGQVTMSSKVKDIAAITGRFGVTSGPEDRTLWYVKGGAAWDKTDLQADISATATGCAFVSQGGINLGTTCASGAFNGSGSGDTSRWGWTVGTGVEWALIGNWSTKLSTTSMISATRMCR
jgi:opacity protein-like surface antigen